MTTYIIGEITDEEGRKPLRPIRPLKEYATEEEAYAAIKVQCRFNNKPEYTFGTIRIE